jgi:hypothetical protein
VGRSTAEGVSLGVGSGTRGLWGRRIFLSLLAIVVVAGLFDLLGVRSTTTTARAPDGTALSLHYAQVARAGLDVPFEITVRQPNRFTDSVKIAVSTSYLSLFDLNGTQPQPSSSTATQDQIIWEFDPPPGNVLVVTLDMTVQGGRHWGRSGSVTLLDREDHTIVRSTFHTWLSP